MSKIFKTMNIPWSTVNFIAKKGEKYGACVNLPAAGIRSDCVKRELAKEATKTPVTPLKEFQALATEIGEIVHKGTVGCVLYQSKHETKKLEFARRGGSLQKSHRCLDGLSH